MWTAIRADELLDDAVAEMEMEDDLRMLKLSKDEDLKRSFMQTWQQVAPNQRRRCLVPTCTLRITDGQFPPNI